MLKICRFQLERYKIQRTFVFNCRDLLYTLGQGQARKKGKNHFQMHIYIGIITGMTDKDESILGKFRKPEPRFTYLTGELPHILTGETVVKISSLKAAFAEDEHRRHLLGAKSFNERFAILNEILPFWLCYETQFPDKAASLLKTVRHLLVEDRTKNRRIPLVQFTDWIGLREWLLGLESPSLNDTEKEIIRALGKDRITGESLAKKAKHTYQSNFKNTLSSMVKRGILGNQRGRNRGYFLKPEYYHFLES